MSVSDFLINAPPIVPIIHSTELKLRPERHETNRSMRNLNLHPKHTLSQLDKLHEHLHMAPDGGSTKSITGKHHQFFPSLSPASLQMTPRRDSQQGSLHSRAQRTR